MLHVTFLKGEYMDDFTDNYEFDYIDVSRWLDEQSFELENEEGEEYV